MDSCLICQSDANSLLTCLHCRQKICCRECLEQLHQDRCPHCRTAPIEMIDDQQNLVRRESAGFSDFERFLQLSTNPTIPVLEIDNRKGGTGYIDFLRWSEVTGPKMRGTDCYGRPFLVVKFAVLDRETETEVDRTYMETFFQRYSTSKTSWQGAGHATAPLIHTMGGMDHEQFAFVNRILEGRTVTVTEDIRSSPSIVGQKCRMMTQEESVNSRNQYF